MPTGKTARHILLVSNIQRLESTIKLIGLAAAIILLCGTPILAQDRFEVQPFVGYKFGGTIQLAPNSQNIVQANFKSNVSYGVTATYNATPNFGLEFMWNRQPTTVVGERSNGTIFPTKIDANLDQYHGNIVLTLTGPERKLRPFILVGLGATHAGGENANGITNSATKFSFGFGGGVRYFFSEHVGLRTQIRYAPTYVYSTTGAIYCDWWGFCWSVPNDHYLQQGDVTGGLVFRF